MTNFTVQKGNAELFSVSCRAGCPVIFQLANQLKNGVKRKSHFRFASLKMPGRRFSASPKDE
jgi:hypothetical protein